jgi:hypothetical protein
MDSTSTIIGLVILALIILPFALLTRKSKGIEKQHKLALAAFAQGEDCEITKQEIDGDLCIGIDENKNKLFFLSYFKNEAHTASVDLSQMESCNIIKTHKEGMKDVGDSYSIASLLMNFKPKTSSLSQVNLEFYNSAKKVQVGTEYVFLREWSKLVNDQLKAVQK